MEARTKTRGTFVAVIAVVALALAGVVALAGCSAAPAESEDTSMSDSSNAYEKITADEAKTLIDDGGVTVVDVRTRRSTPTGTCPAPSTSRSRTSGRQAPELTDTDDKLIVYCRTGVRSKQASDKRVALGFTDVNDMGGIVDWYGTVAGSEPDGA